MFNHLEIQRRTHTHVHSMAASRLSRRNAGIKGPLDISHIWIDEFHSQTSKFQLSIKQHPNIELATSLNYAFVHPKPRRGKHPSSHSSRVIRSIVEFRALEGLQANGSSKENPKFEKLPT
jgi:hypothetical protein